MSGEATGEKGPMSAPAVLREDSYTMSSDGVVFSRDDGVEEE